MATQLAHRMILLRAAHRALLGVLAFSVALMLLPPSALALKRTVFDASDNFEPDGRISLTPDRVERDVIPGEKLTIPVTLMNRTEDTVTLDISVSDLAAASETDRLVDAVKRAKYGAGSWVTPEVDHLTLVSGEQVEFDLAVLPPPDAPVGSNLAGLLVSIQGQPGKGSTKVGFNVSGLSQLFLTVPGKIKRDTRIVRAKVADRWLFNGSGFVTYEITVENRGNVNDIVGGDVSISSMFGNTVNKINVEDRFVLRNSTRTIRAIWANPPRFGKFSGEVQLDGRDGSMRRSLPSFVIFPPWWWIVLTAIALLIPVAAIWHRRRNSWMQYLDEDDWDDDEEWQALT